jgi:cytochrome P450
MRVEDLPRIDIASEAFTSQPLAEFDALRPQAWAATSERGIEVFSYRAVEAAYKSRDFSAGVTKLLEQMGLDPGAMSGGGRNLQTNDTPDHPQLRRIVSRWFTPRQVDNLRPRVEELAGSLAAPITEAGSGEFMSGIASRIPGSVFCWMIGAPDDVGEHVYKLSETILQTFDGNIEDADDVMTAAIEMRTLVEDLIEQKRRRPDDALLSILLAAVDDGDLTVEDVHSLTFEMLSASTDNTAHSAGLAGTVLGREADRWAAVRDDRTILPNALEECARVEPRVRVDSAWTESGGMLLDLEVPPQTMVWQHIAAAHVDADVFTDPYRVDVTRPLPESQLNFGVGRHYCLGAALARMELAAIYTALLDRWSEFTVDAEPIIDRSGTGSAVKELRFTCTPA